MHCQHQWKHLPTQIVFESKNAYHYFRKYATCKKEVLISLNLDRPIQLQDFPQLSTATFKFILAFQRPRYIPVTKITTFTVANRMSYCLQDPRDDGRNKRAEILSTRGKSAEDSQANFVPLYSTIDHPN